MGYDKTRWMSWLGAKNKLIRFLFRSRYRSGPSVGYETETVQPGGGMPSTECRSSFKLVKVILDQVLA